MACLFIISTKKTAQAFKLLSYDTFIELQVQFEETTKADDEACCQIIISFKIALCKFFSCLDAAQRAEPSAPDVADVVICSG